MASPLGWLTMDGSKSMVGKIWRNLNVQAPLSGTVPGRNDRIANQFHVQDVHCLLESKIVSFSCLPSGIPVQDQIAMTVATSDRIKEKTTSRFAIK